MIYKSILEEWPYHCDTVWLRWTEDGNNYKEELISLGEIEKVDCIGVPEWRPISPPEWMSEEDQQAFLDYQNNIKKYPI